jgi:hypothetical protein
MQLGRSGSDMPQQAARPAVTQAPNADKAYVVKPPAGRYHESLWEIAHNHLGDGRRYREIFELNSGHIQPDGSKLTIASLIRPGWVLQMPRDAYGPGIHVVTPKTQGTSATVQGNGQQANGQQAAGTSATTGTQAPGADAAQRPVRDQNNGVLAAPGGQSQGGARWPYELSSASLLAAGVLVALGRRRREQLWRRAFGRRVAAPDGDAALAEKAMRLGADDPSVRLLDIGLRYLSRALAAQDKTPPTVFAAHLGQDNLDLWIAPPDPNPPRPWEPADGGQLWRLPVAAISSLDLGSSSDPGGSGIPLAPYPGLVSIGTNDTGRILVDLEVAHGLIAVRGPHRIVQAALAALAVELITNRWSDEMRVTLVGFGAELTTLAPDRVTAAATLDEVLPALEARAAEAELALTTSGIDSVLTGRSRTTDPSAFAPHYLIMGEPPTPTQRERLVALARTRHRMAAGYVVAGDVRGATWTWDVTEDGHLKAGVLGFDLDAQLLPPQQYEAVIDLFRAATRHDGVALTDPAVGAAPAAQLVPGSRMAVEISLRGPAEIHAPGPLEPDRFALATELVVYLAAHPSGVHLNVLTGAVWPRGVQPEVRDAALGRVQAWLGTDHLGRPNLRTDAAGRLRLGSSVRVDWQVFRALVAQAGAAAAEGQDPERPSGSGPRGSGGIPREGGAPGNPSGSGVSPGSSVASRQSAEYLGRALTLVRGQVLDGRDPGRYAWLGTDSFSYEVTALVADTAHRLSALLLDLGDAERAMEAARTGLRLAFNDELLWRDLLLGAAATGQEHVLRAVVGEVSARVALDEVMPRMAPETEALIDELLPSWRTSAA